ncbi:MAG: hypothetical protein QUU85_05165 [Candidatus Eisenbacteria bacterium]|nr:hypothetical protein [Candidatus Eisenbacteria bacterium]
MRRPLLWTTLLAVAWLAFATSCSKDHDQSLTNPRDPDDGASSPPVPVELSGSGANRSVTLRWELPDSSTASDVRIYRIWKRVLPASSPELVDSSATSPKTMRDLHNGQPVAFSVSSVLRNGLEGRRSPEVIVSPGLFAVTIESGRAATSSQDVAVLLQAPDGTSSVSLSSDPSMSDPTTLRFSPAVSFRLPAGDGAKTVYARFVDADGNESEVVSDDIRLDTHAAIESVEFDGSDTRAPGDRIVFRLDAGETGGVAALEVPRGAIAREMHDDGIDPDAVAGDGIYTLLYEAEPTGQFIGGEVVGTFQDEAGNRAPEKTAARRLTIHADPPALQLNPPSTAGPRKLSISWSQVPEGAPFGRYRLYRATSPGVADLPSRRLVQETTSPGQTTFTDSGLTPGVTYYYVVELVDPNGFATPSNEVSGAASASAPPEAVLLHEPYSVTEESVSLSWSRAAEQDFGRYRVIRGEQAGVLSDPDRRVLTEITNSAQTTYDDRLQIEEGKQYYYVVVVEDSFGESAPSNEESATIPDRFPAAVTLNSSGNPGETTASLGWTRNGDRDFGSYRLYRSEDSGVTEDDDLVSRIDEQERTSWEDAGLIENTEYFYRLFVHDNGGHVTPSNEVRVKTANADPPALPIQTLVEEVDAPTPTVGLTWSRASVHDFDAYRLYRDTSPGVTEASTLVRSIDDPSLNQYRDAGLKDNTRYYYRLFLRDDAGGTTGSAERSIVTENRTPTPVTLSVGGTTTTTVSLTWTMNTDDDFRQYQVLRGMSPGSINTPVVTLDHREQTTYADAPGTGPNQDVYYRVVVFDRDIDDGSSLQSSSNIVSARLSP